MYTELDSGLRHYFNQLYYNPHNLTKLQDLVTYTESEPREGYPNKKIDVWTKSLADDIALDSDVHRAARAEVAWLGSSATLLGAMEKYDLDALIVPSHIASNVAALAGTPPSKQSTSCRLSLCGVAFR